MSTLLNMPRLLLLLCLAPAFSCGTTRETHWSGETASSPTLVQVTELSDERLQLDFGAPRYAVAGGKYVQSAATAHVVADGTIVIAGVMLDARENRVYLKGHQGPHPEEYHEEIHQRLLRALGQCRTTQQCKSRLVSALRELAEEVCTKGSRLHRLATKT